MTKSKPILILVSVDRPALADRLTDRLLSSKLVASAHRIGPVKSEYWWEGKIHRRREWECHFRSVAGNFRRIEAIILEEHSYAVPEIFAVPIAPISARYATWLRDNTRAAKEKQLGKGHSRKK